MRVLGNEVSDHELITAVRGGDTAAFAELYERHAAAARSVARQYVRSDPDADDVVSDAFARVLSILETGGGPNAMFRAYLFTVVRRLAFGLTKGAHRTQPTDDDGTFEQAIGPLASTEDPALAGLERSLVAQAYYSLPERWRAVLWYTEVEELPPAQIALVLGMSANSVSALAYRAREGLRRAYLQSHLRGSTPAECRAINPLLGAYVRDGLSNRDAIRVDRHLSVCKDCPQLVVELADVSHSMRSVIAPLVLGTAALGLMGSALPLGSGVAGVALGTGTLGVSGVAAGGTAAGGTAAGSAVAAGTTAAGSGVTAGAIAAVGTTAAAGTVAGAGTAGIAVAVGGFGAVAAGSGAVAVAGGGVAALLTVPLVASAVTAAAAVGVGVAGMLGAFSTTPEDLAAEESPTTVVSSPAPSPVSPRPTRAAPELTTAAGPASAHPETPQVDGPMPSPSAIPAMVTPAPTASPQPSPEVTTSTPPSAGDPGVPGRQPDPAPTAQPTDVPGEQPAPTPSAQPAPTPSDQSSPAPTGQPTAGDGATAQTASSGSGTEGVNPVRLGPPNGGPGMGVTLPGQRAGPDAGGNPDQTTP